MNKIIPELVRNSVIGSIKEGKRLDGRAFDEYRPIEIEIGDLGKAEGSARVKIGNTRVECGVKIGEGEPYPDSPDEGILTVNAELVPMASPYFQPGPPDERAIELARVVDRGIRESKSIELKKLCITPEELVKVVYIDAYVLDYDGNYIDAAAFAAVNALQHTEIPEFGKLPVVKKPISNTFAKIGDAIVLDPSLEEESVMDARLTVTIEDNGHVCAMQKGGSGYFTADEIKNCIKTAKRKTKEIRKLVK